MKIYAVRDRLLDYFQQPFVGAGDPHVKAALARLINDQEATQDVAQAPQHFEVWSLGEITEDGHITARRELVCDCSSLIRRGVRAAGTTGPQSAALPAGDRPRPPRHPAGTPTRSNGPSTLPEPAAGEDNEGTEVRHGPRGGYPPRDDTG